MIVALGSTSGIKREALREACAAFGTEVTILAFEAPSRVNAQPVGREETLAGARNRARAALAVCPRAAFALGIENGLFLEDGVWRDAAIAVLLTPLGKEVIVRGPTLPFPAEAVEAAHARGFAAVTVGSIIAERFGGDSADPHATLTGGKSSRKDLLIETLKGALSHVIP